MDTLEQYIKMCDCEEIQDYAPIIYPDLGEGKNYYGYITTDKISRKIWLPYQDQIQEMFFGKKINLRHSDIVDGFYKFYRTAYATEFNSMEQLWLAFYMYEKHQKVWDGGKWK